MIDRTNGSGYLEIVCGCEHKGECTAVGTRGSCVDVNIQVSVSIARKREGATSLSKKKVRTSAMHETNRTRSLLLTACAAAVTREAGEDAAKVEIHSSVAGYEWLRGNVQSAAHVDQNGAVGVRWVVCD